MAAVAMTPASSSALFTPPPPVRGPTDGDRPLGVTLVGLLYGLFAVGMVLGGFIMLLGAGFMATFFASFLPWLGALGAAALVVIGLFVLALGALFLLVTFGIFQGRPWAWTTVVVLEILAVASGLMSLLSGEASGILSLAFAGLILWYFFEPAPKAYFGKVHVRAFWQKATAPRA